MLIPLLLAGGGLLAAASSKTDKGQKSPPDLLALYPWHESWGVTAEEVGADRAANFEVVDDGKVVGKLAIVPVYLALRLLACGILAPLRKQGFKWETYGWDVNAGGDQLYDFENGDPLDDADLPVVLATGYACLLRFESNEELVRATVYAEEHDLPVREWTLVNDYVACVVVDPLGRGGRGFFGADGVYGQDDSGDERPDVDRRVVQGLPPAGNQANQAEDPGNARKTPPRRHFGG